MNDAEHPGHDQQPGDAEVIVEQGEWGEAEGPQKIETLGLGTCIGVATYDPYKKHGHMAHFQAPKTLEQRMVTEFLDSVTHSASATDNLRVWLRGGQLVPDPEMIIEARENREYLLDAIEAAGIQPSQIDIHWDTSDVTSTSISLDCSTGEFHDFSTEPDENRWPSDDSYDY